ncbi:MAG: AAC(3) family N-acetyltransferase [Kineosporiaceae bacterium]
MTAPHSVAAIIGDLRRLGVRDGDLIMVHASLRAVGPVRDGAEGVVRALGQAVGSAGTVMMNLGAAETPGTPFHPLTTPADPDCGVLAEVFRTLPGTLVSDHPDGRFGARGAWSASLLADQPWHDYYGPGSPLDRLAAAGGRVLRLGADPDTVTLLHLSEYHADVPGKRRVSRPHLLLGPDGEAQVRVVSCLDDSDGIVDWPGEDYFAMILGDYLAGGRAATGTVGAAGSELIDAADLVTYGARWMTDRFTVPPP